MYIDIMILSHCRNGETSAPTARGTPAEKTMPKLQQQKTTLSSGYPYRFADRVFIILTFWLRNENGIYIRTDNRRLIYARSTRVSTT